MDFWFPRGTLMVRISHRRFKPLMQPMMVRANPMRSESWVPIRLMLFSGSAASSFQYDDRDPRPIEIFTTSDSQALGRLLSSIRRCSLKSGSSNMHWMAYSGSRHNPRAFFPLIRLRRDRLSCSLQGRNSAGGSASRCSDGPPGGGSGRGHLSYASFHRERTEPHTEVPGLARNEMADRPSGILPTTEPGSRGAYRTIAAFGSRAGVVFSPSTCGTAVRSAPAPHPRPARGGAAPTT